MARRSSGPKSITLGARGKGALPVKTCARCGRPFEWRKKWEKVWEEVRFCSEKCRKTR
ncbi:DUF2256 domain-containing protein [Henriciella sp.]|uniref:DUF2256 domain-containing protein n=1 Tax=Henriciella sp. TaxID=1968823 RepID=UPI0026350DCE|nr:DUF2256 domain-containing protein [Henriciella sp.]